MILVISSSSTVTDRTDSSGDSSASSPLPGNPQNSTFDYPYAVSPALFPAPAQINSSSATSLVRVILSPTSVSGFGMINTSQAGTNGTLWFESGAYSALYATDIQLHSCYANCSTLPLSWTRGVRVATFTTPITADAFTSVGDTLIAAASSAGSTYLYQSGTQGQNWTALGGSISGTVNSISTSPSEVTVATVGSTSMSSTTDTLTGARVSSTTISPSGSGATGILQTGLAVAPDGAIYLQAAAMSVLGSNEIQIATSTNGGATFSTPQPINAFRDAEPTPALASVGQTRLAPPSSVPGQMAMTSVGSTIFLIYSTQDSAGQVEVMAEGSSNFGKSWYGPFNSGPVDGTVQNISLSVSPTGLVYAAWIDPDYGAGGIVEAIYSPDGVPLMQPTVIADTGTNQNAPSSAPSIAVDGFQRPLIAWPSDGSTANFSVSYSGAFLSINRSLDVWDQILTDPLVPANFANPTSGTEATFNSTIASDVTTVQGDAKTTSKFCNLQNVTVRSLYAEATAVPVNTTSPACGTDLSSTGTGSPIEPTIGTFSPNTYLATYGDWLLESEGLPVATSPLSGLAIEAQPTGGGASGDGITVSLYSPTTVELSGFPGTASGESSSSSGGGEVPECSGHIDVKYVDTTTDLWLPSTSETLTVGSGSHTWTGSKSFPGPIWVTGLPPDQSFTFDLSFTQDYKWWENETFDDNLCPSVPISSGTSGSTSHASGSATTTLSITGGGAFVHASFTAGDKVAANVSYSWGTTMPATGVGTLTNLNTGATQTVQDTSTYQDSEDLTFPPNEPTAIPYAAAITSTSRPGSGAPSGSSYVYTYESGVTSSAETASSSCDFTLTPPGFSLSDNSTTILSPTSAEFSFEANTSEGTGFVSYASQYEGYDGSISSIPAESLGSNEYLYRAVLDGLLPWMTYNVTYGLSYGSGCVTDAVHASAPESITTPPVFSVWEQDLPYDSISHTGGGAEIEWSIPSYFMSQGPTLDSGFVSYDDLTSGSQAVLPISASELFDPDGLTNDFALNLTLPTLNDTYSVLIGLNYTNETGSTGYTNATGSWEFIYEKDSSGDGLTDVEKENGWIIPLANVQGGRPAAGPDESIVTANPSAYSTNGLVSDYVEKELDLDPNTLDTAGSHMLDTWNLTFSLNGTIGWGGGPQFNPWNETYDAFNPFGTSAYYAPGDKEGGKPLNWPTEYSNLTPSPVHGIYSGDGSSWAARVLWSPSAFSQFLALWHRELSSDWVVGGFGIDQLGAVIGEYKWSGGVIHTITIWGKLSWGADPLVVSTPNDGIPDGLRVNPQYDVALKLGPVYSSAAKLKTGTAYAVNISYEYIAGDPYAGLGTPANSVVQYVWNYSSNATIGKSPASISGYQVTLPANQTYQNQTISFRVIAQNGTGPSGLSPLDINHGSTVVSTTYDLVLGGAVKLAVSAYANLTATLSEVPIGAKAPTWLWIPTDNSTLNGLPQGVERYTGEQSFDLVVVNASTNHIASYSVPQSWGGSGGAINLTQGLNDFLIPREQFLDSPFGQALFLGRSTSYSAAEGAPPLIGTAESKTISGFGSSNVMANLGAYWQNRAIEASSSDMVLPSETGTPGNGNLSIQVLTVTSATPTDAGGLSTDPSIYTASDLPAAVQSILTLNITNDTQLNLLLAALVDNTTGGANGVNGTLQSVTNQIGTLDLDPVILNAIPNATVVSDGLSGPPVSSFPPPPPPSGGIWGLFWNAPSLVFRTVANTILSIPGAILSASSAAATYIVHLAVEMARLQAQIEQRVATVIVDTGETLLSDIQQLLTVLRTLVYDAFEPVVAPLVSFSRQFSSSLDAASNTTILDVQNKGAVSQSDGLAWARTFDPAAVLGVALGTVITVVIGLLIPLTLGAGFLIPILLSLLPTFGQHLIPGLADITSLTKGAITGLETQFRNTISSTDWTALAESVGIAGSSVDFGWSILSVDLLGGVAGRAAGSICGTMIIDAAILLITFGNIALNSGVVAAAVLALALIGATIAGLFLAAPPPGLEAYALASLAIATIGLVAGGADLDSHGWL
jgi:hypothetical protein